jgi:Fur family peroxide stress response transcriptional regulator
MAERKHSRQREAIRENLKHRNDHPTADMIYSDVRKEFPNISLGTVYRNLSLLRDLGEIRVISGINGADRFDGSVRPHDHFICRRCGCVCDIDRIDAGRLVREAESHFDGSIEDCCVAFYGLCPSCSRQDGGET